VSEVKEPESSEKKTTIPKSKVPKS